MGIERIGDKGHLSEAIVRGDTIYLAGITARTGETVAEQTKDVLDQIDALLAQAGSDKTKVLSANIWLTDIGTWAEMNTEWDKWVVPGQTPARATVESKLAAPGLDVEIMVEAAILGKGSAAKASRPAKKSAKKAVKKATKKATKKAKRK